MLPQVTFADDSSFADKATGDWHGVRKKLQQKGIEIGIEWQPEGLANFVGGIRRGITGASTLDMNATLDTEKAFGWRHGKFYIDLQNHQGGDPTHSLVGDLQFFDKLNFSSYFRIYEFWYQQTLCNEKLRIKIGNVDANTEFSVIENGLSFLNSSTQVVPTVLDFPTTPDPVLSANIFFTPIKSWFLSFGIYNANQHNRFGVFYGHPQTLLTSKNGQLYLSETGIKWDDTAILRTGYFKLGFWQHTGTFRRYKGGKRNGASGYYTIFNQTLWQPTKSSKSSKVIKGFLAFGQTQGSISITDWSYTAGVTWAGFFFNRDEDILGFSANHANISPQAKLPYPCELALELNYQMKIYKGITFTPDLQYIIHPSGKQPNALAGTLHMEIVL